MYYLPIKISIYGPVNALMWYDMTCSRNLYVNVRLDEFASGLSYAKTFTLN